jgi:urease accessory protein
MHAAIQEQGWEALLELRFARESGGATRTVLAERRHRGPLVVQRPFHPEGDPCHVYLVHPPGGVVGGDRLTLAAKLDPRAHALITTPAATKFYRCDGKVAHVVQNLCVREATLEWLPQENIFYRGADARVSTRVELVGEAAFIGWEVACLGLPARGEPFDAGELRLDLELWRCGDVRPVPLFIERARLSGASAARHARWGLAGAEALGTLLATGASPVDLEAVRERCTRESASDAQWAATLVDGVLVLRALAAQAAPIRHLFQTAWQVLRPAVAGRVALAPRIWST